MHFPDAFKRKAEFKKILWDPKAFTFSTTNDILYKRIDLKDREHTVLSEL